MCCAATQPKVKAGPRVMPGAGYSPPMTECMSLPAAYSPGITRPPASSACACSLHWMPQAVPMSPAYTFTPQNGPRASGPRQGLGV